MATARTPPRLPLPRNALHRRLGASGALLSVSVLTFAGLAESYAARDWLAAWDSRANRWLHGRGPSPLADAFEVVTAAGATLPLLAVTATAAAALAFRRRLPQAALVVLSFAGALAAISVLKQSFDRPRPVLREDSTDPSGSSFPSGHAAISTAVYGAIVLVLLRELPSVRTRAAAVGALLVFLAAIALSRVYLGVHYLSDVLAGIAAGIAVVTACVAVVTVAEFLFQRRAAARVHPTR